MNKAIFIIGLATLFLAGSCRSSKSIRTAISKKDSGQLLVRDSAGHTDSVRFMQNVYQGIVKNTIDDFETFSAKVKVDFQGADDKRNDFNAFIRLKKDSVIWVSVNALLGIEAFRVLITPDSVKVLNKLNKVVQLRSVEYLQEITKLPFTFKDIQDLILGNPVYFSDNILSYKKEGESITILTRHDLFRHLLTVHASNYVLSHSKLDDVNGVRSRTGDITYGDYTTENGRTFSTFRKITFSEKAKLDIEMKYKQFEFNIPLNFPFSIPKNFKLQ